MEQLIRRIFVMMALLMAVLIATFYLGESRLVAVANLMLVAAGFWLTTSYLRDVDRGR
jgi:thiol:disulfide interchange protein